MDNRPEPRGRRRDATTSIVASLVSALLLSVLGFLAGMVLSPDRPSNPSCRFADCMANALEYPVVGAFVGFVLSAVAGWWWGLRWYWMPLTLVLGFASLLTWPWLLWGGMALTALVPVLTAWLARPTDRAAAQRPSLRRRR